MTRLSEALKKAAADTAAIPVTQPDATAPASTWQFSPIETMHVPDEAAFAPRRDPEQLRRDPAGVGNDPVDAAPVTATVAPHPIPDIRVGDADRERLVVGGMDANVVEQYRQLAAVLHHAQRASGVRSVMVTSAMPSEGKTLTATNLALTLSQSYQRRVLLIDADLRRPRMREMFALPNGEGLTDSLAGPCERLPVHQITPTLWVLSAGRMLPDPMSMLVSPAMKQLLGDARDSFDWVVVDTPPIAILPDANLLSEMIDTALLVVSAQSTPYPMVQRAAGAIGPKRILGVVLNRADKSGLAPYSYYGYPGHQQRQAPTAPNRWFRWLRRSPADSTVGQRHVQ